MSTTGLIYLTTIHFSISIFFFFKHLQTLKVYSSTVKHRFQNYNKAIWNVPLMQLQSCPLAMNVMIQLTNDEI